MKYTAYSAKSFRNSRYFNYLSEARQREFTITTQVLHFKVNNYVLDNLLDWDNLKQDPMFTLLFPQKSMMLAQDYQRIADSIHFNAPEYLVKLARHSLYPPHNSDYDRYIKGPGIFHLFSKTLELFPHKASTCHSYCTYCHRWMPLVDEQARFNYNSDDPVTDYLQQHPEIEDVIFSGGDPMVMSTTNLIGAITPLLEFEQVRSIRFITKSLAWWPHRFTTDKDSDQLLAFFNELTSKGLNITFIAHFTHPKELATPVVKEAVNRLLRAGIVIRCQGPCIKGINDNPKTLAELWSKQVQLGMVPYYLFGEFNYGPGDCFKIPVARLLEISQQAIRACSGLVKTIRAPVLSDNQMKVSVEDVVEIQGEKHFVLKCINSAISAHVGRVFFEKYDNQKYRLQLDGINQYDH
jgi:L-lysine 2,3-aminomutase